jgi:hypothetical protein
MTRHILLALLLLPVIAGGCYYDSEEALYPQLSSGCDTTSVTFAGSIQPMLSRSCYSCHSSANAAVYGDNIRLESYNDVRANMQRVYGAIAWLGGYSRMPKSGAQLSDCEIQSFAIWMREGAPNNAAGSGGGTR